MYTLVLLLHSWLRWGVLLFGAASLLFSMLGWLGRRPFTRRDRALQLAFVSLLDLQLLLGLALYVVLSPLVPHNGPDFKTAMHVAPLRFFAVEHLAVMLVAVVIAHVSSVLARKAPDDATRHRRWALGLISTFLLVMIGIPWAGLTYGRPNFRAWQL